MNFTIFSMSFYKNSLKQKEWLNKNVNFLRISKIIYIIKYSKYYSLKKYTRLLKNQNWKILQI
jgi:hypothetical protein